jgi:glutathione synthase
MRIAFVVNGIQTEWPGYTTTHLAMAATHLGHEAWYVGIGDFVYNTDEHVHAHGTRVRQTRHRQTHAYLQDLWGPDAIHDYLDLSEFDVILLRNDPADDVISRPWARLAGINFARFAARSGVLVVNDPDGLCEAVNKLYLQRFPVEVRPRVLVTRKPDQIKDFCEQMGGTIVLKPLYGSGGRNVFLVRPEDVPNLNQMIEVVTRDGYIIAQEYLPKAVEGDIRLFLLNGKPLQHKGHYAAIRRVRCGDDMRSNMSVGANSAPAVITDEILQLAEEVRPQLQHDGMFFVGLDIVGDKLMEINVFSPGGLESSEAFTGARFSQLVIEDLERKIVQRREAAQAISNKVMAVL